MVIDEKAVLAVPPWLSTGRADKTTRPETFDCNGTRAETTTVIAAARRNRRRYELKRLKTTI